MSCVLCTDHIPDWPQQTKPKGKKIERKPQKTKSNKKKIGKRNTHNEKLDQHKANMARLY
jgi:hypothetical protein